MNKKSWIQKQLLHCFNNKGPAIAIRDCTAQKHIPYSYQALGKAVFCAANQLSTYRHKRALLLLSGDTHFVVSVLACFLAGVTAVPVNLPSIKRLKKVQKMLSYVLNDCEPEVIVAHSLSRDELQRLGWSDAYHIVYIDEISDKKHLGTDNIEAVAEPVLLQYSSGSTGRPKAICNFGNNIKSHHEMMVKMHPTIDCPHTANWLPFYHDLGLFYGLLFPIFSGGCCTFMRPSQFIDSPLTWLQLVARYRANIITAPDFAYQLCVNRISKKEVGTLDLSCLKEALTAAEPIRPQTLDAFAQHFAPANFSANTYMSGYGMAEATLVISYHRVGTPIVRRCYDKQQLLNNVAVEAKTGRELVSSGRHFGSWDLAIVDTKQLIKLEERQIGEVWVSGPCLAKGYWNKEALTQATFCAKLINDGSGKHYLRTGDLAFLDDGELFVCGRLKDVIIVAGKNHMPNDLEASIEKQCPAVAVSGACFVQDIETGKIYAICELHRHTSQKALNAIANDIRNIVLKQHGLLLEHVILLPIGGLKKTSSGKIRRNQMLGDYQSEQLQPLYVSRGESLSTGEDFLCQSLKAKLGVEHLDEQTGFYDLGIDSLVATQWCLELSKYYQQEIAPTLLFAYPNMKSLRKRLQSKTQQPKVIENLSVARKEVAIVAMSCRLPKQDSPNWVNYADWLLKGESAITQNTSPLRHFNLPAGFIDDIDCFDAAFFGISSSEAKLMDPQHRWLMESSWHLFEQAGWDINTLKNLPLGIFLGQSSQDYSDYLAQCNDSSHAKSYLVTGNSRSALSGRLAKFYGTRGAAITLDSACSSSLVAIDLAVDYIRSKKGDIAIAGGVNCLLSQQIEQALIGAGMLSPSGRCATLSADADGYTRAEGLGLLLLKDFQIAQADKDPILAVIEASATAQDGQSSSLTAPNPIAQQTLLQKTLDQAKLSAEDLDAIELHGTGTSLGDPIELSAIDAVYGVRESPLSLTAAKSQMGHLESAAGVAGVIRAVAQMYHQQLFGHPSFTEANPHLSPWIAHYRFTRKSRPQKLRRMAVSAMSFTGTMGHLILRHHPQPIVPSSQTLKKDNYLPLSAFDTQALKRFAQLWQITLTQYPDQIDDLLDAWLCRRSHGFCSRVCLAFSRPETLQAQLQAVIEGKSVKGIYPVAITNWLKGEHYDWSSLAKDEPTLKATLLLPLYPFAKVVHWIGTPFNRDNNRERRISNTPLVDTSSARGQSFLIGWLTKALTLTAKDIGPDDDLISLGLDSLQMMDLVDEAKNLGIKLALSKLYETPTLSAWLGFFEQTPVFDTSLPKKLKDESFDFSKPFALTAVQNAYWEGRKNDQVLGGIACQVYFELNCPKIDCQRLNQALTALNTRHSLLRMRMLPDGRAQIGQHAPPEAIEYDWHQCSKNELAKQRLKLRSTRQTMLINLVEVSGLAICVTHDKRGSRLHVNVDMVLADALSILILMRDLDRFYQSPTADIRATEHFPRYLRYLAQQNNTCAKSYWLNQVPTLPLNPDLPLSQRPEDIDVPKFTHREWRLNKSDWQALQNTCHQHGITPSMMLATCYAETLRGWSNTSDFCLNLTIFNRRFEAFDISDIVADFTTLMLLACRQSHSDTIIDNAKQINQTFMESLDHCDFGAISVLKAISQHTGSQVTVPIVFTSNLGTDFLSDIQLGKLDFLVSQTPQVWIDCQVMEHDGELIVSWDAVDALFPEGMLMQMFTFMIQLIELLAKQPAVLHQPVKQFLSQEQLHARNRKNSQNRIDFSPRTLHSRFFELSEKKPGNIALIDSSGTLTYRQLAKQANALAKVLYQKDVSVGDRVAILLPKGHAQVVSVLAIHLLGAAYVPLDTGLPKRRLQKIIHQAILRCIVSDEVNAKLIADRHHVIVDVQCRFNDIKLTAPPKFSPEQTAYIIYTSGSTGVPKGVITTHQAAANTIDDVNTRTQMTEDDCVFAVSALNFDLSVFDIFAPLSIGATIIIPDDGQRRDAKIWLLLLSKHKVTIWNSVPALFDMLLIAAESQAISLPLRHVLLSGDWINLDLPELLKSVNPHTRLTALGGATEAAIWSNWFDVDSIAPQWKSIPYGYSLSHQHYRVMDHARRDCPDWVTGELWIGGRGVAQGYFSDLQKTADQFVIHEGQKYYRTGDMGKFCPDGTIALIGRQDNQVKIRGYRIELGDIESVANQYRGVDKSVALVVGEINKHIQLVVEGDKAAFSRPVIPIKNLAKTRIPSFNQPVTEKASQECIVTAHIANRVLCLLLTQQGVDVITLHQYDKLAIEPRYHDVVTQWLVILVENQYWQQSGHHFKPLVSPEIIDLHQQYQGIYRALTEKIAWFVDVIQGNANVIALLGDDHLAPEALVLKQAGMNQVIAYIVTCIRELSIQLQRPVNVIELNGQEARLASVILMQCEPDSLNYWVTESTASMREKARYRLAGFGAHAKATTLNDGASFYADLVISNNALHRFNDISTGVDVLANLLAPSGHFIVVETQLLSSLAWLTVCLLQPEHFSKRFDVFTDKRAGSAMPLMKTKQWLDCIADTTLIPEKYVTTSNDVLLVVTGRQSKETQVSDTQALSQWLAQRLPSYMLPKQISLYKKIPLTANGKVDRKQLQLQATQNVSSDSIAKLSDNERLIVDIWKKVLGVEASRNSNFFQLGGDSLHATRIVAALEQKGFNQVKLSDIFRYPVLHEFTQQINWKTNKQNIDLTITTSDNQSESFALTDVQRAYIAGRQNGLVLGGVGTHFYTEFDFDCLNAERLQKALMQLIARHPTLRLVFNESGEQQFLPEAPECPLTVIKCEPDNWYAKAMALRQELSHRVLEPTRWPLFHFTLLTSPRSNNRLFVGLDNLILDGLSMRIVFAELSRYYDNPKIVLPALGITFKDYQDQIYSQINQTDLQVSKDYWLKRLQDLPSAPRLPLAINPSQIGKPKFVRRKSALMRKKWQLLVAKARAHNTTPSCLLLGCYAKVLAYWSEISDLTINVTLFDRKPVHKDINNILGDFTALLLLETHQIEGCSWQKTLQNLQQRLLSDLAHAEVSAIWVMRELARQKQVSEIAMPVVFTSALGADVKLEREGILSPDKAIWGISQTPQVWIDHQVFEHKGALHFNWDVVDGLFPTGMVDAMFASYCELLDKLIDHDWEKPYTIPLPKEQQIVRQQVNETATNLPKHTMAISVYQQMVANPQGVALVFSSEQLTYATLHQHVSLYAQYLKQLSVVKGDCIGVMMPRSIEQIVAVLAIQWIGAAYVPIAVDWPAKRVESVISQANINTIICQQLPKHLYLATAVVMPVFEFDNVQKIAPEIVEPSSLAYVIFTSGSTGKPKGVAISHQSAMNTIEAINRQHRVTQSDCLLALSALYFDLSVYDIFGILSAGGKLVLISDEQQRDISVWQHLLETQQISLWNTAPALLELALLGTNASALRSLRCVMLSGDWISRDLPKKLRAYNPDAVVVAMGGATEASIWSNYWIIETIDPDWHSIPYGLPLPNQCFKVVNAFGEDCPDWVSGELWIGGQGVALGYKGNPTLTQQQFVIEKSQRWYRTGDMGRYRTDGILEFLGRKDQQVKVAGLRIELDEISHALRGCDGIKDAIVISQPSSNRPQIHAYLLGPNTLDFAKIEHTLRHFLPTYALPDGYVVVEQWPLTNNGKIDRKTLTSLEIIEIQSTVFAEPNTPEEKLIAEILAELLKRSKPISLNDNFFAIGGDSFSAIRLTTQLAQQHNIELPLQVIFNLQTVEKLAAHIGGKLTKKTEDYEEGTL